MPQVERYQAEFVMIGPNTIEVVRPNSDAICSPEDIIEQQPLGQVEKLYLAREQGPCGGVEMAELVMDKIIEFRDQKQSQDGELIPIFANHPPSKGAERTVLYEKAGVAFGTPIEEVPESSIYLFSAHGADPAEKAKAIEQGLYVIDTTCPLVGVIYSHVERGVERAAAEGIASNEVGVVFLAGKHYNPQHPEVKGTKGVINKVGARFIPITSEEEAVELAKLKSEVGPEGLSLAGLKRVLVTGLTTNNSDATRQVAEVFSQAAREHGHPESFVQPYNERSVCRTVKFRQESSHQMVVADAETVIVVGALDSHNTNELVGAVMLKVQQITGTRPAALKRIIFANSHHDVPEVSGTVGIVSGASTQQLNIDQIVFKLNIDTANTTQIGDTDKVDIFKPMGGPKALARRILDDDFSWLTTE